MLVSCVLFFLLILLLHLISPLFVVTVFTLYINVSVLCSCKRSKMCTGFSLWMFGIRAEVLKGQDEKVTEESPTFQ